MLHHHTQQPYHQSLPVNLPLHYLEYHTIKKNETFYSIAKQYNLTVQELKQLNKVDINNLKIGQKIKLR